MEMEKEMMMKMKMEMTRMIEMEMTGIKNDEGWMKFYIGEDDDGDGDGYLIEGGDEVNGYN
jgi:hypothetical protein